MITIDHHLVQGGMADVYLGRLCGPAAGHGRVVVKRMRQDLCGHRECREMFLAEARITLSLRHPNVVQALEQGQVRGQPYLALERIDGLTLHQLLFYCRVVPLPVAESILDQVLQGLDYIHGQGVVHRDLSSANVLCSRRGQVKIIDFGIAAPVRAAWWCRSSLGSDGYSAPEQRAGAPPDVRADVYSAGVLLGELLAGRCPALQTIVRRATQLRPEDRYQDAAAMRADVTGCALSEGALSRADLARLVQERCGGVCASWTLPPRGGTRPDPA